jgi:hypothetical protein
MRVSGRGGSESLMFIAPAAIFGGFFLWMYGGPLDALADLDRFVLHGMHAAMSLCSAAIELVSKWWA